MPQPIVHFEIAARDADALKAFYETLLGWKIVADRPVDWYGLIDAKQGADFGIDGGLYKVGDGDQPGVRIYANVDDADVYMSRVESLGGKVIRPAGDIREAGIRVGVFSDPEGNVIGVVAPASP